jgi:uncharacterized protein (DUF1810 family)
MSGLDRFIKAQEDDYETALKEIKNGKKSSCWMWYIFPQIKGLGMTTTSQFYGIDNIEEAIEYLHHELLRNRLIEISNALLELEEDTNIHEVMGFPDDLKLKSSMTLFKKAEELSDIKFDNIFGKILDRYYNGEEDNKTLTILEKQKYDKEFKKENENNDENNSSEDEKKEDNREKLNGKEKENIDNDNKENKNSENIIKEKNEENKEDITSKEKEKLNYPTSSMEGKPNNKEGKANEKEEIEEVENEKSKCCSFFDYCIII